jgi:NADH-quinone oxidoreductase subunit D
MLTQSEVTLDELRHLVSNRALEGETMLLNMGPQHPSTHGVLRLLLELDGEVVVNCIPDIGFLHTGIEKNMEAKTYEKAAVMTDRLDYLNNLGNNLVYCLAIASRPGDPGPAYRAAADLLAPGVVGHPRPGPRSDVGLLVLLSRTRDNPGYI